MKKKELLSKKIRQIYKEITENYLLEVFFIVSNLINGLILRIVTVGNFYSPAPFFIDLWFLLLASLILLFFQRKGRIRYIFIVSIILNLVCIVNSIYYHYYSSFASFSLIGNLIFAKDVGNAIVENVLRPIDLVYIWQLIVTIILYYTLKHQKYFNHEVKEAKKTIVKKGLVTSLIFLILGAISMPISSWGRLYKLWNRESVVISFGIYTYQMDDFIQSLTPQINTIFGHDNALKVVTDYYKNHKYEPKTNEYTNIFKGKNVLVIHAESLQTFPMNLSFNDVEVTPNLNKLASEGLFFSNFYSEVGVGTSSDAEFTFNTSLMPSTKGTVFVNFFDREYVTIPKLLKKEGYYTFSMHANTGDFWNRNNMHKSLGYDKFYSKDSYIIDETIGLGLSDVSFFNQSVNYIKEIKETSKTPFYGLLITLTNHTPFSDLELIDEYPTTITTTIDGQTVTRDYIDGSIMGNYIRSVHYADMAIGNFLQKLDDEGLLEDTIIVIYGDHDARIDYSEFNKLYNYDPLTDQIRKQGDDGYIPYNKYDYELDRKVPFIIWSKEGKLAKEITTPMGMIDVLPTLGNMLDIHNPYELGKDILSIKDNDNTVVFVDGSFLTSKIYYNAPRGEIYPINNEVITEDYIKKRITSSLDIIEISNDIISYNLIKELNENGGIK